MILEGPIRRELPFQTLAVPPTSRPTWLLETLMLFTLADALLDHDVIARRRALLSTSTADIGQVEGEEHLKEEENKSGSGGCAIADEQEHVKLSSH